MDCLYSSTRLNTSNFCDKTNKIEKDYFSSDILDDIELPYSDVLDVLTDRLEALRQLSLDTDTQHVAEVDLNRIVLFKPIAYASSHT